MFFVGSESELLFGTVVFRVQCHLKIELQLPPLNQLSHDWGPIRYYTNNFDRLVKMGPQQEITQRENTQ
jgi:hypothetical protein